MIKLNVGCGDDLLSDWINIDYYNPNAQVKMLAEKLEYNDNYADEINASHIIEHFNYLKCLDVLKEWNRVLKPGGIISIETPDMMEICKGFVDGPEDYRVYLYSHFFAVPHDIPGQIHRFLFTEWALVGCMQQCGFKDMKRVQPNSSYSQKTDTRLHKNFLRIEALK